MLYCKSTNYSIVAYIFDLAGTVAALLIAGNSLGSVMGIAQETIPLPVLWLTGIIWTIVFFMLSVYDPTHNYRTIDELQSVIIAAAFSGLVLAGALYFSYRSVSRSLILVFYVLDISWLIGWRVILRVLYRVFGRPSYPERRVLIVGANGIGHQTANKIQEYAWTGLNLAGYVDDCEPEHAGHSLLGGLDDICKVVEQHAIQEVVIALPYRSYEKLDRIVLALQSLPVKVRIVPNYLNLALYRATVEDFGGIPLINLRDPALSPYQRLVKRIFDLIVGTLITLVALPFMGLVALAIKLDSPGPIIFKQTRLGENGQPFKMYKFRSMVADAETRLKHVIQHDDHGRVIHKVPNDPRVTRVGRFIRRTSLDELPQLFNVLKGEMSLVGPRPEMPWLVEQYAPWQRKRFAVPQGITGWWQINGRDDKLMHLHTEDDLYYIQNYSILLDLQILWKTIGVVLKRRGAF
mgnify:CR=1 FL=1